MSRNRLDDFDWEKAENDMHDILAEDPIPELTRLEAQTLVQRVLGRIERKPARHWFEVRPAFVVGFAAAAVLLLVFGITKPKKPETQSKMEITEIIETYENREPEELLIDAVEDGKVEEDILVELLPLDSEIAEEIFDIYTPVDINERIDMLSEDEAEGILMLLDELGYPGKEEV
ncbi:hypothetical protein DRQ36_04785 [bacterium]|nr:MAG: hypothetical protein DRQ36_04785 [bacterium]